MYVALGVKNDRGYAWIVLCAIICINIIYGSFLRTSGLLGREMVERYEVKKGNAAVYQSIFMGVRIISSIFIATTSHLLSFRSILGSGSCFIFAGCILGTFTNSFDANSWITGSLCGLGVGLIRCISVSAVNQFFDQRRSFAMGLAYAGASLGGLVGSTLMPYLFITYAYMGGLLLTGAYSLNVLPLSLIVPPLLKDSGRINSNENRSKSSHILASIKARIIHVLIEGRQIVTNHIFWVFTANACLLSQSINATFLLIPNHAFDGGLSLWHVQLLLVIHSLLDIVARILLGYVADRGWINRCGFSALLFLLHSVVWLVAGLLDAFPGLLLLSIGEPFFGSANMSILASVLPDLIGRGQSTQAFALYMIFQGLLFNLVLRLVGLLRDTTGSWYPVFYLMFGFNLLSCGLTLVKFCFLRRQAAMLVKKSPEALVDRITQL